jgi:hypothetical protein
MYLEKVTRTWASALTLLLFVAGTCSSQASNTEGQTSKGAVLTVVQTSSSPSATTQTSPTASASERQFESGWFGNGYILVSGIVLVIALIAVPVSVLFIQASRLKNCIDELEAFKRFSLSSRSNSRLDHELSRKKLEQHLSDLENRLHEMVTRLDHLTFDTAVSHTLQPSEAQEEPCFLFPAAVEECLARLRERNIKMLSVRSWGGHVIEAERAELLLVMGDSPERPLLIIPSIARFSTKQDYYDYFAECYHCDKVTSGEVWIIEPAVANRIQDGWSLGEKGRLEIR